MNPNRAGRQKLMSYSLAGLILSNPIATRAASENGGYFFDKGKQEMTTNREERQVLSLMDEEPVSQAISAVAWSPDGNFVVASGSSTLHVTVWDARSLSVVRVLDQGFGGDGGSNVAFSPNGRFLASGLSTVNLWDPASGKLTKTLVAPHVTPGIPQEIGVRSLAFSPDSKLIVVAYDGKKRIVIAYRVDDGKIQWTYEPQRVIGTPLLTTPVTFSVDGKHVILGTGERGGDDVNLKRLSRVLFLNTGSGALIRSIDDIHVMNPTTLTISPNGRWVATGTSTGVNDQTSNMKTKQVVTVDNQDPVRIWDMETGKLFRELPVRSRVWSLAFSHDGKTLFGAKSDIQSHMTLAVWDVESGRMVQEVRSNPGPMGLVVSPDGKRLAAASQSKLAIYEIATGK
ncbi:MAG: PQQ-binding-like beta-propeller repeat protein [Proteobacteria bacterium]|nr:PQQ-binding-like beta-propeller repeat protein [Pseudomonadota bacterium]